MKKSITAAPILLLLLLLYGCLSEEKDPRVAIEQLENEIFSGDVIFTEEGKKKASELVRLYEDYVEAHPDDTISAVYLFKAADISLNLDKPGKAINTYNRLIYSYPDYEKAPECLFLVAYIYENHLQNYGKATELYQKFLETYPESDFADDARISIENMGKSPEELIKQFEQQNQEGPVN